MKNLLNFLLSIHHFKAALPHWTSPTQAVRGILFHLLFSLGLALAGLSSPHALWAPPWAVAFLWPGTLVRDSFPPPAPSTFPRSQRLSLLPGCFPRGRARISLASTYLLLRLNGGICFPPAPSERSLLGGSRTQGTPLFSGETQLLLQLFIRLYQLLPSCSSLLSMRFPLPSPRACPSAHPQGSKSFPGLASSSPSPSGCP